MKRIIALTLAFLMMAALTVGFFSASAVSQSDVDKLKTQLSGITAQKNALQKEINKLKKDKASMAQQIDVLDRKVAAAEEELALQQELIENLGVMIGEKRSELAESEAIAEQQRLDMRERVRFMAEHGSVSYLSILFSADNFVDFLTKYEVIKEISSFDSKMFDKYKKTCAEIENQKLELEKSLNEADAQQKILEQNKLEYEAEMAQREKQMEELVALEKETQQEYNSIAAEEEQLSAEIKEMINKLATSSIYVGGKFQWPLPAANNVVTCKYGMRVHPITKVYKLHTGVDLRASSGTKIYAANAGTVKTSTYSTAYGNYVVIDHGGGVATLYAHMTTRKVKAGDKVTQGQVIGLVGSTGYSTGPHLHFEIIKNGDYIDPITQYPNFKVTYK